MCGCARRRRPLARWYVLPYNDVLARRHARPVVVPLFVAREAGELLLGLVDDPQGVEIPVARTLPAPLPTFPALWPCCVTLLGRQYGYAQWEGLYEKKGKALMTKGVGDGQKR